MPSRSTPPPRRYRVVLGLVLCLLAAVTDRPGVAMPVPPSPGQATELPTSGLVLAGPARAGVQIQTPGRRAAWFGSETGDLEAWVYPLKIVRGLDLAFRFRGRTLPAAQLARRVEVRPEWTAITYGHEAFAVRMIVATPIDEPANLLLLEADASFPLEIEVAFHIDLQPMWPGGLGGQYSYWDEELPGFVIGEGSGRNLALIASPAATDPTIQPAHSLPEDPTRFVVPVQPGTTTVPIVVTAWTEGMPAPEGLDGLRARYSRLVADAHGSLAATADHYRRLDRRTVSVQTPDEALNEAYRWAKVRLDQGVVCNPHLGCGLVAGYGRARAGQRPGFGWFFGGDAFYNSWALTAAGSHDTVRTALEFLARYQRDDGKIMHELAQSAGSLNWFEDYPYGFYHAEGSPYFIDAVARHVRSTGDVAWGREMLPSVRRAYAYSLAADSDGDGLMENSVAGLGAVEMGALREASVHQDLYLVSLWARALRSLAGLADALGETELTEEATAGAARARDRIESLYWLDEAGHYAFGTLTDGSRLEELTVWSALPTALGLSSPEHAMRNSAVMASPAVTTDWGARMLASTSPLYDPLVYNQGTVWPFLSGFAGLAAWEAGNPWAGLDLLRGLTALTHEHTRGAVHEVLSGDRYEPMGPSVPQQLFSTSSLVTPLVNGLFGLDVDATRGIVTLAPRLPADWSEAHLESVRYREGRVSFHVIRPTPRSLRVRATWTGSGSAPALHLAPALPAGAQEVQVFENDRRIEATIGTRGVLVEAAVELSPDVRAGSSREVEWRWRGGLPVAFRGPRATAGGRSTGIRVAAAKLLDDDRLEIVVAGRPGVRYTTWVPEDLELAYVGAAILGGASASAGGGTEPDGHDTVALWLDGSGSHVAGRFELRRRGGGDAGRRN